MNKSLLRTWAWNLGFVALGVLPACLVLAWIQAVVTRVPGILDLGYALETGGFFYLVYVPGFLIGTIAHQSLLLLWTVAARLAPNRITVAVLSPVIPLGVLVIGERLEIVLNFAVPVMVSLALFAALCHLSAPEPRPATGA